MFDVLFRGQPVAVRVEQMDWWFLNPVQGIEWCNFLNGEFFGLQSLSKFTQNLPFHNDANFPLGQSQSAACARA